MAFASLSEFLAMGGHGLYVWSAWGVTGLLLLALIGHACFEQRQLRRTLKRRARLGKAQYKSALNEPTSLAAHAGQRDTCNDP